MASRLHEQLDYEIERWSRLSDLYDELLRRTPNPTPKGGPEEPLFGGQEAYSKRTVEEAGSKTEGESRRKAEEEAVIAAQAENEAAKKRAEATSAPAQSTPVPDRAEEPLLGDQETYSKRTVEEAGSKAEGEARRKAEEEAGKKRAQATIAAQAEKEAAKKGAEATSRRAGWLAGCLAGCSPAQSTPVPDGAATAPVECITQKPKLEQRSKPCLETAASTTASVTSGWTAHVCPDGDTYYHNDATGESSWDTPKASPRDVPDWTAHVCPDGDTYYHNEKTGESIWHDDEDTPGEKQQPGALALPAGWSAHVCPDGDTYYHNESTGESAWNTPR